MTRIKDWKVENLTEEQKKILEHQVKNADYSKIEIEESDSAKYFKENYYVNFRF